VIFVIMIQFFYNHRNTNWHKLELAL